MKKNVLIVAHPDDEVLFFSSILESFAQEVHVICVTDGNADGRGVQRKEEFKRALNEFGVNSFQMLDLPDAYNENIPQERLEENLRTILKNVDGHVFTHGPFGDYGHPHHIQVAYTVHKLVDKNKIFTPNVLEFTNAHTFIPDKDLESVWERKLKVFTEVYALEYERFVTLIPARFKESFLLSNEETTGILNYLQEDTPLPILNQWKPFKKSLELFKKKGLKRAF